MCNRSEKERKTIRKDAMHAVKQRYERKDEKKTPSMKYANLNWPNAKNGCIASQNVWPHRFKVINWSKGMANTWKKTSNYVHMEFRLQSAAIFYRSFEFFLRLYMWSNKTVLA